ncbi:MAG: TIGR02186 family protein [Deltaproteobacteria bacterium]|nr:TIGR02186 family protein [Deltaproteobacteria bacterium]
MLKKISILLALSCCLVLGRPFSSAASYVKAHLSPEAVDIGAFFNGAQVYVTGDVSRDAEVVVRLSGMGQNVALKKKGKILGLLWMNLGSVTIHNVPNLYLIYISKDFKPTAGAQPDKWEELGLGFAALKKQVDISSAEAESEAVFEEFLKLKESEGLYAIETGQVTYGEAESGGKSFRAVLQIPPRLTPGKYLVETFAVKDASVAARTTAELQVKQVGLPAFISRLAFKHGALYGLLAAIIAIAAGLLMGVIFKGEKGAH